MISRRKIMASGAVLAGGALLLQRPTTLAEGAPVDPSAPAGEPGPDYTPVITPNGTTLPFKRVDGAKVFHLVAEEFDHEFAPGLRAKCWGYNGRTPGPTIEVVEGDRVRIYVTNHLPEPTSVHWHGILLPAGMDGVAGLTQKPIPVGATFKYEFTLRQHGTHMYHSHFDEMTQIALGAEGMFIVHPREPQGPKVDRDFAIMLSEWRVDPGTSRPEPTEMTEFNLFTMNGKVYPGTEPLIAKVGERIRVRVGNLGPMDHHPIHLHGYEFEVTEVDGGVVPASGRFAQSTVLVSVGTTRAFEFVANEPGDWAMHCHMTHHTMNQMGHGTPNMIGVKAGKLDDRIAPLLPGYMTMGESGMGEMSMMGMPVPKNSLPMVASDGPFGSIDMGGMFTVLKVRADLATYADPGWYKHPAGTVAEAATAEEMRRDGVGS